MSVEFVAFALGGYMVVMLAVAWILGLLSLARWRS